MEKSYQQVVDDGIETLSGIVADLAQLKGADMQHPKIQLARRYANEARLAFLDLRARSYGQG